MPIQTISTSWACCMWYLDEARCLEDLGRRQFELLVYLISKIDPADYQFKRKKRFKAHSEKIKLEDQHGFELHSIASELADTHIQLQNNSNEPFLLNLQQIYKGFHAIKHNASIFCGDQLNFDWLSLKSHGNEVDLMQKVARIYYLLLDEPIKFHKTSKARKMLTKQFAKHYHDPLGEFKSYFIYNYKFVNQGKTIHYVIQALLHELIRERYLFYMPSVDPNQIALNDKILQEMHLTLNDAQYEEIAHNHKKADPNHCVFCDQTVIERQHFIEEERFTILFNYLPYTWPHFMLIPKIHQENLFSMSQDWLKETSYYLVDFARKLENYYKKPFVFFNQNGSHAGQTQPHTHIHILPKPSPLEFKIKIASMLYRVDPNFHFLGDVEMENARNQLKHSLKNAS